MDVRRVKSDIQFDFSVPWKNSLCYHHVVMPLWGTRKITVWTFGDKEEARVDRHSRDDGLPEVMEPEQLHAARDTCGV